MPGWSKAFLLVTVCVLFVLLFSGEIRDNDVFWHLKTGQYIIQNHSLPVPDPFSYTSHGESYAGEEVSRRFNLTHEWLSQVLMYLTYRFLGFPGLVAGRVLLLSIFCGFCGWIVWQRTGEYVVAVAAMLAAAAMSFYFAQSRPFLATFVFLALTMAILETRRWLWALPPLFVIWANCHGGFVLGWVMCAAYSLEVLVQQVRDKTAAGAPRLLIATTLSIALSGLNPNGFRILQVLQFYRSSGIQTNNLEWQRPIFWAPGIYSLLLFGSLLALLIAWRKARFVDWFLYLAFAAISLIAIRNTIFIGLVGSVIIATYLLPKWRFTGPLCVALGVAGLLAFDIAPSLAAQNVLAFRAATWQLPSGAADFIERHRINVRMFNNYEAGGYLIWRLWPLQRDFIDGRGLSENAFADYKRILYDESGANTGAQLLDRFGIEMLVTEGFDYLSGQVYPLAVNLASGSTANWKLVFADEKCVIFLRNLSSEIASLNAPVLLLDSLAAQCTEHMRHDPLRPRCAFGLGELYAFRGEPEHARHWLGIYNQHRIGPDHEADEMLQSLSVTNLNQQATKLQSQGKTPDAEAKLRQALATAQRTLGPEHPDTAGAMNNLATVLESEGKYLEAESLSRQSLAICEKVFGQWDPRTAMALDNLAGVLEGKGDLVNAESLFRRALSAAERSLGRDDPTTQTIREDLDSLLKAQRTEHPR